MLDHKLIKLYFILVIFAILECNSEKNNESAHERVSISPELIRRNVTQDQTLYMEGGKSLKIENNSNTLANETVLSTSWSGKEYKNSTIKPRKGVSNSDRPPTESTDKTNTSSSVCECCVNITNEEQIKNCKCCPKTISTSTITSTTTKQDQTKTIFSSTTSTTTTTAAPNKTEEKEVVIHRPKPKVTVDIPDQQVPAQEQDYVIPVVGIIFALPLVIILAVLVYKKGADLWERRHYRRMDFLIDGIYNQ